MVAGKGSIKVNAKNIFPIIKKWLYSDKDIFARELVVNGCDAITKLIKLKSLGEATYDEKPRIDVICDKDKRTITVKDNGIGMTEDEVKKYINQIAFSGAEEFLEKYKDQNEQNQIIGHFGLGFYSAFMVAKKVVIDTKSYTPEPAVRWTCSGGTEYTIADSEKETIGTEITLFVDDESDDFLIAEKMRSVLLKYCGFLPYEIFLDNEEKSVNDISPIWTKQPSECTDDEYKEFYHRIFSDINDPLLWIHLNVEYPFNLKGILYFPKLTHEFDSAQGKIKLYNNQVFVADNIKEVIPEFLLLLKGVIDCPDLPLNVSRSALQNDGTVSKISAHITKKVADKLISTQKQQREKFNEDWSDIAPFIEYGCLNDEKFYERLKPILQAKTTDGEYVTLVDYAKENDNKMSYATDENVQAQFIKMLKEDGQKALLFPHIIDVHFISFLEMKEKWKFTRIDTLPEQTSDNEKLLEIFKKALGKDDLTITTADLKTNMPALIVQEEQMRRMSDFSKMFGNAKLPETFTLVLNSESKVIKQLPDIDDDKQAILCQQIYDIARLCNSSLSADEMTGFIERSADLLEKIV
ncbi:MAG: molecular chaperone HtpG [Clostridiaceae bacterium]|nr:molecular chaperone HtpG [Clostridiaceae bacterium]